MTRHTGWFAVDNGLEFTPCFGGRIALDGPASTLLLDIYSSFVPDPTEAREVFVDLLGQFRNDGGPWLDALDLRQVYAEGWGCERDDEGLVFEASGTEPFWTLVVEAETLSLITPDLTRRFTHEGLEWTDTGARRIRGVEVAWEGGGQGREGIELVVEAFESGCRDAMSGAWYHMTVEVTVDRLKLQGCGYLGPRSELPDDGGSEE